MQRIRINNHEWEVPNEPGWLDVINEAELVQQRLFSTCVSVDECRQIVKAMRDVFYRYPVSRKYFESNKNDADEIIESIFKWG